MCNEVARAKKIFLGTGSLQASHGCSAHTVLKNIDPHRALPAWQTGKLAYLPLKGYEYNRQPQTCPGWTCPAVYFPETSMSCRMTQVSVLFNPWLIVKHVFEPNDNCCDCCGRNVNQLCPLVCSQGMVSKKPIAQPIGTDKKYWTFFLISATSFSIDINPHPSSKGGSPCPEMPGSPCLTDPLYTM